MTIPLHGVGFSHVRDGGGGLKDQKTDVQPWRLGRHVLLARGQEHITITAIGVRPRG